MNLQIKEKHILQVVMMIAATVVAAKGIDITEDPADESECKNPCNNANGEFCLYSNCVRCGPCPADPFGGQLTIFSPCIQHGYCPNVCSPFLRFEEDEPLVNVSFCEQIIAPKVTTPTPTPNVTINDKTTSGGEDEKSTTPKRYDDIHIKPNGGPTVNKTVQDLNLSTVLPIVCGAIVVICLIVWLRKKIQCGKPSHANDVEEGLLQPPTCTYKPLDIEINPCQKNSATVKGLRGLRCTAIQVCACLHNHENPHQNWIAVPDGKDEMQLLGCMISGQVYVVRAGTADKTGKFHPIAEGKVETRDVHDEDSECSTTVGEILHTVDLRKSLEVELRVDSQRNLVEYISESLHLIEDEHKIFIYRKDLHELSGILDGKQLDVNIHLLMKTLVKRVEAKDFIRKLAKRNTPPNCKTCMELLHTTCCCKYSGNVG